MRGKMKSENFLVQANCFTPQTITCSLTDQLLKNLPVPVCFFYKNSIDQQTLIESFKTVLNDFPVFAGILKSVNGQLNIECNNQGVPFCVEKNSHALNQIIEDLPKLNNNSFINTFDAKKAIANQTPILTIKLTYFACGGMAIGVCWHHAIGDMHTFMQLMKAWSNVFNDRAYELPLIVKDRDVYLQTHLKPNRKTTPNVRYLSIGESLKLLIYKPIAARTKTVLRFYFSDLELKTMQQVFSQASGETVSKNDALCAHIFSLISKLDSGNDNRYLSMAVNYRARENLPDNILGNFISGINILHHRESEPFQLAKNLRMAVNQFQRLHMDFFSTKEYIEQKGGKGKIDRFVNISIDPLKKTLLVTNWSQFGVYDVIFGDAQPFYFSSFSNYPFSWLSSITNGFSNKGLIYSIHLPTKLAKKLMMEENLQAVHKYRNKENTVSELMEKPEWLL